jgi:hypothetical protein
MESTGRAMVRVPPRTGAAVPLFEKSMDPIEMPPRDSADRRTSWRLVIRARSMEGPSWAFHFGNPI